MSSSTANYDCPRCGGKLRPDGEDWFTCSRCGNRVHELAVEHREAAEKWADRDDLESSRIAKALLGRDAE
jgi:tRNA(Ile2) C34 agmatinyltransferase TiaS